MTETTTTTPTLLPHLARTCDVRLSLEGSEFAVGMLEGRSIEVIRLMKSRADWLADVGIRETQP